MVDEYPKHEGLPQITVVEFGLDLSPHPLHPVIGSGLLVAKYNNGDPSPSYVEYLYDAPLPGYKDGSETREPHTLTLSMLYAAQGKNEAIELTRRLLDEASARNYSIFRALVLNPRIIEVLLQLQEEGTIDQLSAVRVSETSSPITTDELFSSTEQINTKSELKKLSAVQVDENDMIYDPGFRTELAFSLKTAE